LQEELREVAERYVSAAFAHIVDLTVHGEHDRRVVELFIDAEGPVTTQLCAAISRQISAELDARTLVPGRYRLEVSSPGIDRPLRFPWQYKKHVGRKLRVMLGGAPASQPVIGVLTAVDEEGILLAPADTEEMVRARWSEISEGTVAAPW